MRMRARWPNLGSPFFQCVFIMSNRRQRPILRDIALIRWQLLHILPLNCYEQLRLTTTIPLMIESTINKRREVEGRGGGYAESTRRGTRTCAHNNQTDHAEGGVVGDDDEDGDGDDGDDDNDYDGE